MNTRDIYSGFKRRLGNICKELHVAFNCRIFALYTCAIYSEKFLKVEGIELLQK